MPTQDRHDDERDHDQLAPRVIVVSHLVAPEHVSLVRLHAPPTTPPASPAPQSPRSLSSVVRVLIGIGLFVMFAVGAVGTLLLAGQTELVARIVVGAVLVVVFGTPLLCLVGLFVFSFWSMTRLSRRALRSPQQKGEREDSCEGGQR